VFESPWARQLNQGVRSKSHPLAKNRVEGSRNGWPLKQMKRKVYRLSREGKEKLIERLRDFLQSRDEVVFAYVFGSFLEEETFHDIDVGVYLSEIPQEQSTQYGLVLSQTLSSGLRVPVDTRVLNFAPASFLYHVIRGKLILERDEEVAAKFTEQTIQRYLDLKPLVYRGIKEAFGG
jgi:uncharacterized protein